MALLGREFVAVPDDRKGQIVFKWPDHNLRKGTRAIVEPDQLAVFINRGQVVGTLAPGRHAIEAQELPFLGAFIDVATGGNAYRAELFFVGTREYPGHRFGGRIDDVQDPQTGLIVTLRVFGDYSLKVTDVTALLLNLTGTVDVTDNTRITGWISDQLLKVMRTEITRQIVRNGWPILGLSAYTPEIDAAVREAANSAIASYGITIVRMGNFDVNLAEEDEVRLKTLAKDVSYTRLAGGFQQYAAGEALLGAGAGMAQGGGAVQGAFLAAGLGLGGQMVQPAAAPAPAVAPAPAPAPAPAQAAAPAAGGVVCASCQVVSPAGSRFCSGCGTAMAPATVHCTQCGVEMAGNARFCPECGTPRVGAAPAAAAPLPPPPPPPA
jgi:membrane protease subunit (stomatin/prohibitin family)